MTFNAENLLAEALAFAAGSLVATSAVPDIWKNIKNPELASTQGRKRTVMQGSGNALWTIYGISQGLIGVTVFCGFSTFLMSALLIQQCRIHAQQPKMET